MSSDTKDKVTFFAKVRKGNDISYIITLPKRYFESMELQRDDNLLVTIRKVDPEEIIASEEEKEEVETGASE